MNQFFEAFANMFRNPEHIGEGFEKLVHGRISTLPPARVIFSSADLLNLCARTVSAAFNSPSPRTLIAARTSRIRPLAINSSGVTVSPAVNALSDATFTTAYSKRDGVWKPRFGIRRRSGIWPPSKPGRRE